MAGQLHTGEFGDLICSSQNLRLFVCGGDQWLGQQRKVRSLCCHLDGGYGAGGDERVQKSGATSKTSLQKAYSILSVVLYG